MPDMLGTFLGIEGTFSRTSYQIICEKTLNHELLDPIVNWIRLAR